MKNYKIETVNENEFKIIPEKSFYEMMESFKTATNMSFNEWLKKEKLDNSYYPYYRIEYERKHSKLENEFNIDIEEEVVNVYCGIKQIGEKYQFGLLKNKAFDCSKEQVIELVLNNEINDNIMWEDVVFTHCLNKSNSFDELDDNYKSSENEIEKWKSESNDDVLDDITIYTVKQTDYRASHINDEETGKCNGTVELLDCDENCVIKYMYNNYADFEEADADSGWSIVPYGFCIDYFDDENNPYEILNMPITIISEIEINYGKYKGLEKKYINELAIEEILFSIKETIKFKDEHNLIAFNLKDAQLSHELNDKLTSMAEMETIYDETGMDIVSPLDVSDVYYDKDCLEEFPEKYWLVAKITNE